MARKTARPGAALVVFFLGGGDLLRLVAIGGTWEAGPRPGPQGGTRITMIARVGSPTSDNLSRRPPSSTSASTAGVTGPR